MPSFQLQHLDALEDLRLDPYNPRLQKEEEGADQPTLIGIMLNRFKVEDVAESILAAGWLEQDPLIAVVEVVTEADEKLKLPEVTEVRVIEGNRRLTAVKLLLDPELAPLTKRSRWREFAANLNPDTRENIKRLNVRVYESRDDPAVSSYIGFRHVTGVLPWPAMEKASYIARLAAKGASYRELAEKLGSYPSHMQRHHLAYQLVEQAKEWEVDGAKQMGNAFGVLLRALQTEGVRAFVDLKSSDNPAANLRPVPDSHREEFGNLIKWTFGTSTQLRILPESRELTKWSKILLSPPAVRYLTHAAEPKFDRAWARSGGESETLADTLWKASYLLADALPLLSEHREEAPISEAAKECERFMRQISALLAPDGGSSGA